MSLIEKFLEMMLVERNATQNTISGYKADLLLLSKFLKTRELNKVTFDDLNNYLLFLYEKGYSTETMTRKIITFRQFYKFLHLENIIKNNPTLNIELHKKTFKIPKYLTEDEVHRLFALVENDTSLIKVYTMLELLYASGMRISELITLKIADINPLLNNQKYIIISGKGNKERIIPFTEKAIKALKFYIEVNNKKDSVWLFPGNVGKGKDHHITRQRFGQILKNLAIKANISPEKVSPHIMRHSFATHLLNNGLDIKTLQDLLGHSSIATTQIYTHIPNDKLQKSILKSHPLTKI
jgi:integrase/recombinase XerD